jgi:hypothetical protein
MSKKKPSSPAAKPEALFDRVATILEQARGNVVRAVNTNMVHAYWLIGREIVMELQGGEERAEYGKRVIQDLSARLNARFGKGYSTEKLQFIRKFYLTYRERFEIPFPLGTELSARQIPFPPGTNSGKAQIVHPLGAQFTDPAILHPPGGESAMSTKNSPLGSQSALAFSPQLTWSHYRALMRVENPEVRDFYEREAIEGGWDKRTLERNLMEIGAFLFRTNGAIHESLGRRPRCRDQSQIQALKGRPNRRRPYAAPSGLGKTCTMIPRALPWAGIDRPVGAGLIETYLEERKHDA